MGWSVLEYIINSWGKGSRVKDGLRNLRQLIDIYNKNSYIRFLRRMYLLNLLNLAPILIGVPGDTIIIPRSNTLYGGISGDLLYKKILFHRDMNTDY